MPVIGIQTNCHFCNAEFIAKRKTYRAFENDLKRAGWISVVGKSNRVYSICPECKEKEGTHNEIAC
jgi:hypothetical protein